MEKIYSEGDIMNGNFLDLCRERYSVRAFSEKKVEEEKISAILSAGQAAPTACDFQPIKIYVIKSEQALEKLQKCMRFRFGQTLAFIVCYDRDKCWVREYDGRASGEVDASITATHMMLEAWEQGIGSTWIMHFIPEAVCCEFSLPENIVPVCVLAMGYPGENAVPSQKHGVRKSIEELATVE